MDRTRQARDGWTRWVGYLAAAWSLAYGVAGIYWSLGGDHFPFARVGDERSTNSVLEGGPPHVIAPAMVVLGLLGGVAGILMAKGRGRGPARAGLVAFAVLSAVVLTLLVQDYTMIAIIAFAPFLLVFTVTGVPGPQEGVGDILYWHRVNLILMGVAGVTWAATAVSYHRRTGGRCVRCGRGDAAPRRWMSPASARRWGRWAVYAGIIVMLPYEITRIAWFLHIPLGITPEFLQMMVDTPGMLAVGLGLSLGAIGGHVLTHGLISRWGEVFPRWVWFRAGRPVPIKLAVIPATMVAVALVPAGLMNNLGLPFDPDNWAVTVPGMFMTPWALALGAATLAYYLRRRSVCKRCGRGAVETGVEWSARGR